MAHLWDGWLYLLRPPAECHDIARPLARRAVALDDGDAMADCAMDLWSHRRF